MRPEVSIIILTHDHPEVFCRLLNSLPITAGVSYEVVVVDNASNAGSRATLANYHEREVINKLVYEPVNHFFSEGNNIGVRNSNPASKYLLLLNSDTEILLPEWLTRMIEWMEGIPPTYLPYTWSDHAVRPSDQSRDIVTIGWSYASYVPGGARPEGWCYMIRRNKWRDISSDFPFHHGLEEMTASLLQDGARAGVLSQYSRYIRHYEGGCEAWKIKDQIINRRSPDEAAWFQGAAPVETLDFTLGPYEHRSYAEW